jgi:DNA-binding NarL/FixJ family response regulator
MRVLIVDDEPLARRALEQALRGRNDIETLDSAKDAIQALEMMQEDSTMCCLSISGCRDSLALTSLIV